MVVQGFFPSRDARQIASEERFAEDFQQNWCGWQRASCWIFSLWELTGMSCRQNPTHKSPKSPSEWCCLRPKSLPKKVAPPWKPLQESHLSKKMHCFCIMFLLFLFSAWDSDVLLVLIGSSNMCQMGPQKNVAFIVDFEAIDPRRADRRCSKWLNVSISFKSHGHRWEWLDPVVWYDRSWDF